MEELKDKNGLTEKEFLANYKPSKYPRPSVTTDCVILVEKNGFYKLLLIQRGGHPFLGKWAFPGGFANENETVEECAARELEEETLIKDLPLEEVRVMSRPGRDPRSWVIDIAYLSLIEEEKYALGSDDAKDAKYFDLFFTSFPEKKEIDIWLSKEDISLHVVLNYEIKQGISGKHYLFKQIYSDLAFDHGEILGYSLEKLKLI